MIIQGIKKELNTKRNYGIDSLRIVSMLLVVVLHVISHGGGMTAVANDPIKQLTVLIINALACCAVNCYAIISGYVGLYSRSRVSSFIMLWVRVVFYSIIITLLMKIFFSDSIGTGKIIFSFFPLVSKQYWYFTQYAVLFLFAPLLNKAVLNVSKRRLIYTILTFVLFFSVIYPFLLDMKGDYLFLNNGYTAMWLIVLYLIGAYLRKYDPFRRMKTSTLLIAFFLSGTIAVILKYIIEILNGCLNTPFSSDIFLRYISITILIEGVALVSVFSRISFKKTIVKIISFVSPLAFSVYLIHDHPLVRENIIKGRFSWISSYSAILIPLYIFAVAFSIFVIAISIDSLREILFKRIKLKKHIEAIETKILSAIK